MVSCYELSSRVRRRRRICDGAEICDEVRSSDEEESYVGVGEM